ncbi:MAG TPA: APC family permease [Candidatus Caldiarchaeum subterraneum]|uniref:APC family permease n=1 Tax=Caldiarchaeum subterraneum TaxID=311458 RepID=A0A832ZWQ4_CALS0|nr:APC family permease [Candidatus Caldarchaeum subterraneum]
MGYALAFNLELFLSQVTVFGNRETLPEVGYIPWLDIDANNFLYGLTLAMASFIGIESIAQAAEETRRPHRWIPRAAKLSIVAVFLSVILFSILSIGVLDWRVLGLSYENPVAQMVIRFPLVGAWLAGIVAFAAFILCYASSNTGVIGVSRLTASMGKFNLLPRWFYYIHPRYRTPTRTIVIFGLIGFAITLLGDIPLIASLYNFGALLSYMLLMLSLILLRNKEKEVYRPWKVPVTIRIRRKSGEVTEIPLIGLLGFVGTSIMWALVVLLHTAGRTFGFIWMAAGLLIYLLSRRALGKGILSHEEGDMVKPMGYRMDVGVLVRPFEDLEVVKHSILHGLDRRFRIRLITIIDVEDLKERRGKVKTYELEEIRESIEKDLSKLTKELKHLGYETIYCVHVGKFDEMIERELKSTNIDMLVFIKRATEKATIEKGHEAKVHNIMLKHPGKIMVLKRVK